MVLLTAYINPSGYILQSFFPPLCLRCFMALPIPLFPSIIATDRHLPIRQGISWEHPAVQTESLSLTDPSSHRCSHCHLFILSHKAGCFSSYLIFILIFYYRPHLTRVNVFCRFDPVPLRRVFQQAVEN
jgi:hypothetical protein